MTTLYCCNLIKKKDKNPIVLFEFNMFTLNEYVIHHPHNAVKHTEVSYKIQDTQQAKR